MPKRLEPLELGHLVLRRYGSWRAFGRKVDISGQAIGQYFGHKKTPGLKRAARMADELGMTVGEFYARLELDRERRQRREDKAS